MPASRLHCPGQMVDISRVGVLRQRRARRRGNPGTADGGPGGSRRPCSGPTSSGRGRGTEGRRTVGPGQGSFPRGNLAPDDWAEQRDELTAQKAAADAEVSRLTDHERDISGGGLIEEGAAQLDQLLAEIRETFSGDASANIDGVRATLARVFEDFQLFPAGHPDLPKREHSEVPVSGYVLVPRPRPTAIAEASPIYASWSDGDNDLAPRLERIPLEQAGATKGMGLTM